MCVHPGGIKTNIARDSKQNLEKYSKEEIALKTAEFEKALVTSPEDAADTIIQGILKKKQRVLIGKDARQFSLITRLFPTGYSKMIIKEMKKQNLT